MVLQVKRECVTVPLPNLFAVTTFGKVLWQAIEPGIAIMLSGELGVGKTTIARSIIHAAIGTCENVPSPTFTLVQLYESTSGNTIWHFDLYRLSTPEDVLELNVEEAFATGISLVEWPEKLGIFTPDDRLSVHLTILNSPYPSLHCEINNRRLACVHAYGRRATKSFQAIQQVIKGKEWEF